MKIFLSLFLLLATSVAQAGLLFDVGGMYLSDGLSGSSSATRSESRTAYSVGLLFSVNKTLWAGWNYAALQQTETEDGDSTKFSSQETGPYIKWQFGKNEIYSMSGAFNIVSRATFSTAGGSTESWEGTSFLLQLAIAPEVVEGLHIGGALNYYSANFTKKTVDGTTENASNTKPLIYPSVILTKQW